ncbi:MAG: histidinol-phosphate transaminase [Bacteriovoracaceae bacterium]|nr:histidinol-phosphate transaminase [Bacteriovoracaceae bacterium]
MSRIEGRATFKFTRKLEVHVTKRDLIPDYLKELKPYQAGKPIEELAREKNLTKISKLASNENPLGPSPFAVKEMTYALWDVHRYPDMHSYELKNELSKLYKLKNENIILANGSEGIMALIARTFVLPGDEVVTSEKTFLGFNILFKGVGAKIIEAPMTKDFKYNVEAIANCINKNTRLVYIANPNNPTGNFIKRDEFDFLMSKIPANVLVILDEAYFEFGRFASSEYPDSMDYRYDNVLTLRTFSKAYGLAGIRVGYGFGHETLIGHLHKIKLTFEPGSIAQKGAVGALADYPHLNRTLRNNRRRYNQTAAFLQKHDFRIIDSVTNFICFQTGSEAASDFIYEELLNLGVIIRPLRSNQMADFIRVSLGSKAEMNHFYEAMEQILPAYSKKFRK